MTSRDFIDTYKVSYAKNYIDKGNDFGDFYDHTEKRGDYWEIDHDVMKHFETIEEVKAPTDWKDLKRIDERFQYHSQYIQYTHQSYELVKTKLGDYLDELFFILSRTNEQDNACKERNFNDALSQGIRYKQISNKNSV